MAGYTPNVGMNPAVPQENVDPRTPDLNAGAEAAAAQTQSPGAIRRAVSTGLMGLGVRLFGSAMGDLFGDKGLEEQASEEFETKIAPAIYQRWYQQDAQAFNQMVAAPYSQAAQGALAQYQAKISALEQGYMIAPDGSKVQIDPISPEAAQMRSAATREMMQFTLSLDQQVIQAAGHPKWADNPYIQKGVSDLMKSRVTAQESFLEAHKMAMEESKFAADMHAAQTEEEMNRQAMEARAFDMEQARKLAPLKEEDLRLGLDERREAIATQRSARSLHEIEKQAALAKAKGAVVYSDAELTGTKKGREALAPYQERATDLATADAFKRLKAANPNFDPETNTQDAADLDAEVSAQGRAIDDLALKLYRRENQAPGEAPAKGGEGAAAAPAEPKISKRIPAAKITELANEGANRVMKAIELVAEERFAEGEGPASSENLYKVAHDLIDEFGEKYINDFLADRFEDNKLTAPTRKRIGELIELKIRQAAGKTLFEKSTGESAGLTRRIGDILDYHKVVLAPGGMPFSAEEATRKRK